MSITIIVFLSCRRGYVIIVKGTSDIAIAAAKAAGGGGENNDADDPGKVLYTLGPRFAVDLGKRRLMRAYFTTLDQDMDNNLLKEFKEEEEKEEKMRKVDEVEEEEQE